MKNYTLKLILASSLVISGCDDTEESIGCTADSRPAITIDVLDKDTGDFIACNAIAVIKDTGFSEELTSLDPYGRCDNSHLFQGANERSGVYDIHVFKEGYLDWSVYSIEVTSGKCHVNTVHIVAELEK